MTGCRCREHAPPPAARSPRATVPSIEMSGAGAPPGLLSGARLTPPPLPPSILPGSVPEAFVVPALPAPMKLDMPTIGERSAPAPERQLTLDPRFQARPMQVIPVPRCIPDVPLTWADLPASRPPARAAAETRVSVALHHVQGWPMFQVRMLPSSSVLPRYRNPADRAVNGCAAHVARCERMLHGHPGNTAFRTADPNCPAGAFTPATATSEADCEPTWGTACDADVAADSVRLLAHEQGHFDLACGLVQRANDALRAGTHDAAQMTRWLGRNGQPQQNAYDHDSVHGCDPGGQATWIAAIAARLPAVPLP